MRSRLLYLCLLEHGGLERCVRATRKRLRAARRGERLDGLADRGTSQGAARRG